MKLVAWRRAFARNVKFQPILKKCHSWDSNLSNRKFTINDMIARRFSFNTKPKNLFVEGSYPQKVISLRAHSVVQHVPLFFMHMPDDGIFRGFELSGSSDHFKFCVTTMSICLFPGVFATALPFSTKPVGNPVATGPKLYSMKSIMSL